MNPGKRKIALATIGSLGDLYPILGLARELKARGHEATVATSPVYEPLVLAAGVGFHAVAPDLGPDTPGLLEAVLEPFRGPERLHREFVFPALERSFEDFLPLVRESALVISSVIAYHAPIAAEVCGRPWVSALLSPLSLWSAHDPPVLAQIPFLGRLRALGPGFHGWALRMMFKVSARWTRPVKELRTRLGLSEGGNPFVEGVRSERLILAMFSRHFSAPQPDWPPQTVATGFVFYDPLETLDPELDGFLGRGEPPVIFALGSTTVLHPGRLLEIFFEIAQRRGGRSVVLAGPDTYKSLKSLQGDRVFVAGYASYGLLFPRGSCIVHQGGVGTTAQALRSGRPMLVLPSVMDQYDNAEKVRRLGVALVLPQRRLTARPTAGSIERLLSEPGFAARALEIGAKIRSENGPAAAVDAIEDVCR